MSVILLAQRQGSCGCKAASHDFDHHFFLTFIWENTVRGARDGIKWSETGDVIKSLHHSLNYALGDIVLLQYDRDMKP